MNLPQETGMDYIGDSLRLRQILFNLIDNALKFTPQGEVSVSVTSIHSGLRFEVKDSGIGIPEASLDKLFSRFVQVDASTSRKFGGTGLGLVICKKLVEGMNGHIGVQSAVGKGSLFWIELPLLKAQPKQTESEPALVENLTKRKAAQEENPQFQSSSSHTSTQGTTVNQSAARILLVEDHPINQKLVIIRLNKLGYQVDLANDGAQGVLAAQSHPYCLILMDLQMPILDGFAATREIRASTGPNKATPIVALTANAMQTDKEACFDAGMNDFLTKPFSNEELIEIIERYIPEKDRMTELDLN